MTFDAELDKADQWALSKRTVELAKLGLEDGGPGQVTQIEVGGHGTNLENFCLLSTDPIYRLNVTTAKIVASVAKLRLARVYSFSHNSPVSYRNMNQR